MGEFFGLSPDQLHYLLCFCHHGETLTASATAAQVRALTRPLDAYRVARIGIGIGAVLTTGLMLVSGFL